MRRLAGLADDAEHVLGREVEDLAARDAHSLVAPTRRLPGECRAFLGAHANGANDPAAEAGMGLQIATQLALDRPGQKSEAHQCAEFDGQRPRSSTPQ